MNQSISIKIVLCKLIVDIHLIQTVLINGLCLFVLMEIYTYIHISGAAAQEALPQVAPAWRARAAPHRCAVVLPRRPRAASADHAKSIRTREAPATP